VATLRLESAIEARPVVFDMPIVRTQSPFFKLAKYPVDSAAGAAATPWWFAAPQVLRS